MDPVFTFLWLTSLAQEQPSATGWGLIDLISGVGISGVFIYLWYDATKERRKVQDAWDLERRENQKEWGSLLERVIAALTLSASTLDDVQDSMQSARQASVEPDDLRDEIAALVTELKRRREG